MVTASPLALALALLLLGCPAAPEDPVTFHSDLDWFDTSPPDGAAAFVPPAWGYAVGRGATSCPSPASAFDGEAWAVHWAFVAGAEEAFDLYVRERDGDVAALNAALQQAHEPALLFHTCVLLVDDGVHLPVGFWQADGVLGLDYYTEETQYPQGDGATAGLVVVVEIDPEEPFFSLDARHLGYHERDSW